MASIYTETVELRACRCDMYSRWKPGAILETMQESAGMHSNIFGLTYEKMTGMGFGWVIARLKAEFSRIPVSGEKITVETYPTPNRMLFYPRSHIFKDGYGQVIGSANTLWLVMDLATRKAVNSAEVLAHMPDNSGLKPAAGMPAAVKPFEGEVRRMDITPQFTDLDTNGHVNNTKYMDWCCNALGAEILGGNTIMSFDINYDAEILPGTELHTELTLEGDRFAFIGYSDEKKHFSIGGRLEKRG